MKPINAVDLYFIAFVNRVFVLTLPGESQDISLHTRNNKVKRPHQGAAADACDVKCFERAEGYTVTTQLVVVQ